MASATRTSASLEAIHKLVKKSFGPDSDCGVIRHQTGDSTQTQSTFLRLFVRNNEKNSLEVEEHARNLIRYLAAQPSIRCLPRLLVSVTGGADLDLRKDLDIVLKKGLHRAAGVTDIWVVTGGTNMGIMKHVGEAMSRIAGAERSIPVIGICTCVKLNGHESLRFQGDTHVPYPPAAPTKGRVNMDPNHNHFIAVEDAKDDWGRETDIKDAFERVLKSLKCKNFLRVDILVPERFASQMRNHFDREPAARADFELQLGSHLLACHNGRAHGAAPPRACEVFQAAFVQSKLSFTVLILGSESEDSSREDHYMVDPDKVARDLRDFHYTPKSGNGDRWPLLNQGDRAPINVIKNEERKEVFPKANRIYSVLLVVGGGAVTAKVVRDAVDSCTPVVVVNGSGRLADLIASAWFYLHREDDDGGELPAREELHEMALGLMPKDKKHEAGDFLRQILELCMMKERVTVFDIENDEGLDVVMLRAILASLRPSSDTDVSYNKVAFDKLHLAMLFQNISSAHTHLNELKHSSTGALAESYKDVIQNGFYWAVRSHAHDFVELFYSQLEQIGDLHTFLTRDSYSRLKDLYTRGARSYFRELVTLDDENVALQRVDQFLMNLVFTTSVPTVADRALHCSKGDRTSRNAQACQDLMLWAVLMCDQQLAEFFWQKGGDSIPNALLCSRIAKGLSENSILQANDFELCTVFQGICKHFEELALGLLDVCYKESALKAKQLLSIPLTRFQLLRSANGEFMDCLELVYRSDSKRFLSHPACLAILQDEWYGDLDHTQFKLSWSSLVTGDCVKLKKETVDRLLKESGTSVGLHDKLGAIFHAPFTKFMLDLFYYLALAFVFVWNVLYDLPIVAEIVLYVMMFPLIYVEWEQMKSMGGVANWASNQWNLLDGLIYFLFSAGFSCRLLSGTFYENNYVHLLYPVCLTFFFLRLLRFNSGLETLGPKLLILNRMFGDLVSFLGLFAVILLAFGTVTAALLLEPQDMHEKGLEFIFFRPMLFLFGELSLDSYSSETANSVWYFGYVVYTLMMFYMVAVNIMLINVLTAMFASSYETIQSESKEFWNMLRYELLDEYCMRSAWPGFFVLIDAFINRGKPSTEQRRRRGVVPDHSVLNQLEQFQELHTDEFLDEQRAERAADQGQMLARCLRLCDKISTQVHALQVQVVTSGAQRGNEVVAYDEIVMHSPVRRRLWGPSTSIAADDASGGGAAASAGSHPKSVYACKTWTEVVAIQRHNKLDITLAAKKYPVYDRAFLMIPGFPKQTVMDELYRTASTELQLSNGAAVKTKLFNAVTGKDSSGKDLTTPIACFDSEAKRYEDSRKANVLLNFLTAYDPDGNEVTRAEVSVTSWDTELPDYSPPYCTLPTVLCSRFAEKELRDSEPPRNPMGRTGLAGRGTLFQWGRNVAYDTIITRFKRTQHGLYATHHGARIVEFLAIRRRADLKWAVPGSFIKGVPAALVKAFGVDAGTERYINLKSLVDRLSRPLDDEPVYMDDPRNTDNAWVVSSAMHIHDARHDLTTFPLMDLTTHPIVLDVTWAVAHRSLDLFVDHFFLLSRAIAHLEEQNPGLRIFF